MSETQHSPPVTFANVPEVTQFLAKFNYNFYTKVETSTVEEETNLPSGSFAGSPHPRDVHLTWKIGTFPTDSSIRNPFTEYNKDKIIFEGSLPGSGYTPLNLDNANLPNRVENLIQIRRILEEGKIGDLRDVGIPDEFSPLYLSQPTGLSDQALTDFRFSLLISPILGSGSNPFSQFDDDLNSVLNFASVQNGESEPDLPSVPSIGNSSRLSSGKPFLHLGFLITRVQIDETGNETDKKEWIIGNPNSREYFDKSVVYGKSYAYEVRAVYRMVIPSITRYNVFYLQTLVASKPVRAYIVAQEVAPPPPPDHIKFLWDRIENKLQIIWNMPYNPQRDIKRFQIFRRESVNNAFELIHEIRFHDNISPEFVQGVLENIPNNLWVNSQSTDFPEKTYVDHDFTKESRYIYALCSIDARYYTSGYSEQFEVYFDKIRNKLVSKQISPRGAPKPYPNLYLTDEEIVKPELSISGIRSKRMNLIFSPQFYYVKRQNRVLNSPKVLKSGVGKYNFHILNIDNQKDSTVEVSIADTDSIIK